MEPPQQTEPQVALDAVQAPQVNGERSNISGWDVRPPVDEAGPADLPVAGPAEQQVPAPAQGEGQAQATGGPGDCTARGPRHTPITVLTAASYMRRLFLADTRLQTTSETVVCTQT